MPAQSYTHILLDEICHSLMQFFFSYACYFWWISWPSLKDGSMLLLFLPWCICLSLHSQTVAAGRKMGGYWSGLMYPNRRLAQGQQTASVCSLADWFPSRLAPVSPWEWNEWELFWNEEGSSIYLAQLCPCMMDELVHLCVPVEPIYCQTPLSLEKGERLKREREREGGRKGGRGMEAG